MISSRFALPIVLALSLALIPTILHNYLESTFDDGKSVKKIARQLSQFTAKPTQRNRQWGQQTFGSEDWMERNYRNNRSQKIRLFVARALDHKRVYHHPELALSYGQGLTSQGVIFLPKHPKIAVHLLANDVGTQYAAYVLLYDQEFIHSPIKHQITNALQQLVTARKPMTLFYVSQTVPSGKMNFAQSPAAALLMAAINSFLSQNPSP